MTEAIIVAIITGICTAACTITVNRKDRAKFEQNVVDRISTLERKVDIHNGYAEKLGDISVNMAKMQKDIEYLREK